jgi:SecD/SecF fusion protein
VLSLVEVNKVMDAMDKAYGVKVVHEENTVDTELATELAQKAIVAVLIASLGIIIYVSIRFEWRFAVAAIIALLHDAFIVVSIFSIFRWEVNLPFVAAVLTIIGYSINDTIVIFDRVRENLRFSKIKNFEDLSELVNRSIWQTMTRSINTILTVLIGALCLFIFGSAAIKYFSLAMIVGLISGGYSSIFIATPLWLLMKNKSVVAARKILAAKE